MQYLIGLDVGTTSSKAVVIDGDGAEVALGRATTPWRASASGVETDALAVLESARHAVAAALAKVPGGEVAAVGVASMAESGVLLNREGDPVVPIIAWHDSRDEKQVHERCSPESLRASIAMSSRRRQP